MYSVWIELLGAVVFVWLGILSFLAWQQRGFLKALFPKSGERDIRNKFEDVVKAVEEFKQELGGLGEKVSQLELKGLEHVQRVKLLRYNPYNETGGDQSFTVAVLDDKGTGFVLTSLHARSGTRVFAKPVKLGHNERYEFSKEEEEAVKQALKK